MAWTVYVTETRTGWLDFPDEAAAHAFAAEVWSQGSTADLSRLTWDYGNSGPSARVEYEEE